MKIVLNVIGVIIVLSTIYYLSVVWIFSNLTLREGQEANQSDLFISSYVVIANLLLLLYLVYSLINSIIKKLKNPK